MKTLLELAHDPEVKTALRVQIERHGIRFSNPAPKYRARIIRKLNQHAPYPDVAARISEIITPILEWHGIPLKRLMSAARDQATFDCRRECIIAARVATDASVTQLGRFFNRDHTAVSYTLRKGVFTPFVESLLKKEGVV